MTLLMLRVVTVLLLHTAGSGTSNITNSRAAFLNVADYIKKIFEYDRREICVAFPCSKLASKRSVSSSARYLCTEG